MVEVTDAKTIEAFMSSIEGGQWLDGIREHLEGHVIQQVCFAPGECGIQTTLHLNNGETYPFMEEELLLDTLREQFSALFRDLDKAAQSCNRKE